MHLLLQRHAMVKPVLATYPDVKEIGDFFEYYQSSHDPFFSAHFEENNEDHIFWEVTEGEAIQQIQDLFREKVPSTYIADGHHRSSTTAILYERRKKKDDAQRFNRLLCAFFPVHELEVFDFNRIVEGLEGISLTTFMAQISQLFDIEILDESRKPDHKHELVMFLNQEWFRLVWKPEVLDNYSEKPVILDADLLDRHVMMNILGIEDTRVDERIKYVGGRTGMASFKSKVLKSIYNIGFLLYPVHLDDMIEISDKLEVMPPKSTWFEPRMKNGLIVYEV
jgi:uncharacterized protein (DUF1015 family)